MHRILSTSITGRGKTFGPIDTENNVVVRLFPSSENTRHHAIPVGIDDLSACDWRIPHSKVSVLVWEFCKNWKHPILFPLRGLRMASINKATTEWVRELMAEFVDSLVSASSRNCKWTRLLQCFVSPHRIKPRIFSL